ncbi:Asp-tRNA(Asn)/Glu-tRNA(Gln) amidotransferase subunit GatA [Pseudobacteriovorax antillogorgiicola]|uniref:Glutamyl-tRNA(Gln) amidotransferase subunit A n=1 Tax=Pseudobacteriovorax antillogorgiicola TaxID=1513793 RepID=A0A1Y6B4C1_9BACT|nr:Asp-tRNA(Asn)/Glu-tRNA(Gln) amidotransferase subunit GatA [Pseudobacteriovorax antillogorgiicola]TCS59141.1 aspartyl/glutamyl-tRNA(Asn/Gln) amidotransferase subunit A [Pseudobacteriovorax antillogorgiicola]SME91272.1 aspartyl/glutamyl-tRNA(Asn/Gln) amidotransferase subunit A [Pseudobacteriovorax antillogorgiicola]
MLDPITAEAWTISQSVNRDLIDPLEVAKSYADRVEINHRDLNTHINWDKAAIIDAAEKQNDYIVAAKKAKKLLPLAGVPIVVKDNLMTKGTTVTCGSKFLKSYRSPYDATVIEKLRAAGAIFMGRANMDEFAMGSSNENSAWGPVKNPVNKSHVPGGSSGGSAAAVAAHLAPLALGTDTGGSIRQPASFCGVVGMKPSYGRVSRYGLVAFGSSLDQVGPIATTVRDAALLYDVIAGHDPKDSSSANRPIEPIHGLVNRWQDLEGHRIGIIEECFDDGLQDDVKVKVQQAIETMRRAGAEIKTVSLPHLKYSVACYYVLATAEVSSNLSRFDGVRFGERQDHESLEQMYLASRSEGFGKEVKQRIMLGTFGLSSGYYNAYYDKATRVRELIRQDFQNVFDSGIDILVSPTAPTTAFELGKKTRDSLAMYLSDVYTIGANLSGIPAISVPCGTDQKGLPIAVQLMTPMFREDLLFKGAYVYEQSRA